VSFMRHKKIYRCGRQGEAERKSSLPSDHRFDESSAGYSFAGCSPAAPTSASPAVNRVSLYPTAVQFSAANRNCHPIPLSQPRDPLHRVQSFGDTEFRGRTQSFGDGHRVSGTEFRGQEFRGQRVSGTGSCEKLATGSRYQLLRPVLRL
jgi:hypothetical protein